MIKPVWTSQGYNLSQPRLDIWTSEKMRIFVMLLGVLAMATISKAQNKPQDECIVIFNKCCDDTDCSETNYCYELPCGNNCGSPMLYEHTAVRVKQSEDCIPYSCICGIHTKHLAKKKYKSLFL
ncbi:hypothetical protein TNCT_624771 [Trichonephila clavata]|uniref:Uncharacterized protein n=1 Tax=Trichonephila clavata TaxID=2740835 RepID=A0A8X6G521_TRICU|nr:hypothetical protein TNCT_624771 [Trichonephila clavata]